MFLNFLTNVLEGIKSFLWGHWYPCFGLPVTSIEGFKVGWIFHFCAFSPARNGFLRFTSGAKPPNLLTASMVAKPFFLIDLLVHIFTSIGSIGGTWKRDRVCVWHSVHSNWMSHTRLAHVLNIQKHILKFKFDGICCEI